MVEVELLYRQHLTGSDRELLKGAVGSARASGAPVTGSLVVAGYMGDHFAQARRELNAVTDRYLFPLREQWFGT